MSIKLLLAPMAGLTDRYFRRICAGCGADAAVTEMVSAKALCFEQLGKHGDTKSAELADTDDDIIPTSVQIFGSDPVFMAEAADRICRLDYRGVAKKAPDGIDINMGCPVRKIVTAGDGSALMKDPELAGRVIEAVVKVSSLPVSVKIRAGWDENNKNAPELAKIAEQSGASSICVHARTRNRFYMPGIEPEIIARVKEAVSIPVYGNGDIFTADDALKMLRDTGCDGVAVARGALGNPWIFAEIKAALSDRPYTPPTAAERIETAIAQTSAMVAAKGARGVAEARGHLYWYVKGFRGAAAIRSEINEAQSFDDMKIILSEAVSDE